MDYLSPDNVVNEDLFFFVHKVALFLKIVRFQSLKKSPVIQNLKKVDAFNYEGIFLSLASLSREAQILNGVDVLFAYTEFLNEMGLLNS